MTSGDFESAGIAGIAKKANSSVGTFYRLIGDKDTLLRAVHDRFVDHGERLIAERLHPARHEGADLEQVLHVFVSTLVEIYSERESMIRALIVRSSSNPEFRERTTALRGNIRVHLGALLATRVHQIKHPHPLEAFSFSVKVVLGTLNYATVVASTETGSHEDLVHEMTQVMVRYLEVQ